MAFRAVIVLILAIALAGCASRKPAAQPAASTAATPAPATPAAAQSGSYMQSQSPGASYVMPVPPLEDNRKVNEQDCTREINLTAGNLRCR